MVTRNQRLRVGRFSQHHVDTMQTKKSALEMVSRQLEVGSGQCAAPAFFKVGQKWVFSSTSAQPRPPQFQEEHPLDPPQKIRKHLGGMGVSGTLCWLPSFFHFGFTLFFCAKLILSFLISQERFKCGPLTHFREDKSRGLRSHRLLTTSPIFFFSTSRRTILTWTQSRYGQGDGRHAFVPFRSTFSHLVVVSHLFQHLGSDPRAGRIRGRRDDRFPRRASHHGGTAADLTYFAAARWQGCHVSPYVTFPFAFRSAMSSGSSKTRRCTSPKVGASEGNINATRQGR